MLAILEMQLVREDLGERDRIALVWALGAQRGDAAVVHADRLAGALSRPAAMPLRRRDVVLRCSW